MTFKTSKIVCVGAVVLAGLAYCIADNTVQQQANPVIQQGISPYAGTFFAMAKMTNGASFFLPPPSNAVSCTFQDASGFSGSYTSSVVVVRKSDFHYFYTNNNNSITFPVTNSTAYQFMAYVNSPLPPPTNGQPMTLQITWQTSTNTSTNTN